MNDETYEQKLNELKNSELWRHRRNSNLDGIYFSI